MKIQIIDEGGQLHAERVVRLNALPDDYLAQIERNAKARDSIEHMMLSLLKVLSESGMIDRQGVNWELLDKSNLINTAVEMLDRNDEKIRAELSPLLFQLVKQLASGVRRFMVKSNSRVIELDYESAGTAIANFGAENADLLPDQLNDYLVLISNQLRDKLHAKP